MATNTEHIFNNEAYARIKAGISDAATSIELYPGHAQIFLAGWVSGKEFYATITNAQADIEIVKVAAISGDTLTVERGQDGTVAQEWKSGAIITQRLVAANLEGFIQREAFREVYYNPNSILTADYPGEKVYQSLNQRIWWKNKTGTIWQAIAGSLAGWLAYPYDPISYASISLRGICWSPALELFCAVGSQGIVCSDNGIDWTPVPMPGLSFQCVCWSPELDLFVAIQIVGGAGDDRFYSSPDGETWTGSGAGITFSHSWSSVCWAASLTKFVAVSDNNVNKADVITLSADGVNWELGDSPENQYNWESICWSPDLSLLCAVGLLVDGKGCMTSPDGANWTLRTLGFKGYSVCWSPDKTLFVAVGDNDVATSPDAVTWTPRIPAAAYLWKSVCWSPEKNLFVAVAAESQDFACMTSPDGITWTLRETPHSADERWQGVCWAPSISKFCAVPYGASGLPHCMLSSNGGA